ncbi:hypothetical protein ACFRH4_08175 [Streptomyces mirabilis]|uniref:hypothetical protein n=1 Tax=Streptomyces mirabilis TaxID=68239 RepID=UPI00367B8D6C
MTRGTAELEELLRRAGLEVVGERRVQEVPSPRFAWRVAVPADAERVLRLAGDRADPIGEFNAQWHRLAVADGVLDEDGVFLIDVAGHRWGSAPWDWTPVRLTDRWDLAGVLGERPGEPKFVALSTDGDSLLGTAPEGDGIRLVAVAGMKERREAAARVTARETAEERAAVWESAFEGLDPSEGLPTSWADGLALNPATPDDLRAGLLGRSTYLMYGAMQTAVVEAAMVHPDWQIRARLAEVQQNITADQWTRLILAEQNERHRWILTLLAAERRAELTGPAHERLAVDPSARIRAETARLSGLSAHLLTVLAADPVSCSSSSPSPATTRPPTCCCGCGSGGPAASAPPTARTATRTSPATTSSAMPTTRTRGCANWPWTTRSRRPNWWSGSAGTRTTRSDTGPRWTRG